MDGFLSVVAREGWQVVPAADYSAMPSGVIEHTVFEAFWGDIQPVLRHALADGLDAIFLCLHGAMVTTAETDPEGVLLRRIRALPGAERLPIFGAYDLHANLTPAMCALADTLICYRENPHIDAFETASRAASLLGQCLRSGVRPKTRFRGTRMILPPTGTGTADDPMRSLELMAREIEATVPGVLAVNVVGGFAFGDTPEAGVAFSAVTEGDPAEADRALDRLATCAWELRARGLPEEQDPDAVLRRVLPVANGPVLLVEPADNIGGGSPGDCTDILRAMLRHDVQGGGAILADAEAVAALRGVPQGASLELALGGKGSRLDLGPVLLEVTKLSESDGRFTLEDRNSHLAAMGGVNIDMGPCALVRHRGITILLTTKKTPPFDLGQWRSQGVDPERLSIIGVKAAVAHRRAYDPIATASFTVQTRGPCTSDLTALPYRRLRRPIFPLDAEVDNLP